MPNHGMEPTRYTARLMPGRYPAYAKHSEAALAWYNFVVR
jgi:hypothetical protein